jgi:hypothetical protein
MLLHRMTKLLHFIVENSIVHRKDNNTNKGVIILRASTYNGKQEPGSDNRYWRFYKKRVRPGLVQDEIIMWSLNSFLEFLGFCKA